MKQLFTTSSFSLALLTLSTAPLAAQCPPADQVVAPFSIPVTAGGWSIQHFAQPIAAGQIDYILISLPAAVPLPLIVLPGLYCTPVGNTQCLYADLNGVSWFDLGPSAGQSVTVGIQWPNNPALSGTLFVAQTGTMGCVGTTELSVLITGRLQ